MPESLSAVELFAGGGGMSLGTSQAGFHHLALLEIEPHAVNTLQENVRRSVLAEPELPIRPTDIAEFDWKEYGSLFRNVDLLAGGAPCQPFSLGGVHRGQEDQRNLFPEVFRAQRELLPKALLLENVRGLARPSFRPYLQYILLQIGLPGLPRLPKEQWQHHRRRLLNAYEAGEIGDLPSYQVRIAALECANFGVPQKRNRIFIVALRSDLSRAWTWPKPTHSEVSLRKAQFVSGSYWQEHHLKPRKIGDLDPGAYAANGFMRWRTVRDTIGGLPKPTLNGSKVQHPNHVLVRGARKYPGHTGSPLDEPAKTLKAGVHGVPGGENMLRHDNGAVRYFTVHESGLLQTFPESYIFCGSRTAAMRQIGNAAPAKVVRIMAENIIAALQNGQSGSSDSSCSIDLIETDSLPSL